MSSGQGFQHALQLIALHLCAGHLLPVDLGTTCRLQLLKLHIGRLPIGADAGVSKATVLRLCFQHIFFERPKSNRENS